MAIQDLKRYMINVKEKRNIHRITNWNRYYLFTIILISINNICFTYKINPGKPLYYV